MPSIAHQIKVHNELNRLNLKTREELTSKTRLLSNPQAQDRFDVSVDLSPRHGQTSGFSALQTKDLLLPKMVGNNKIDSSFLQQSEILRMKPDGFRRISI